MISSEVIGEWCGIVAAIIATISFLPQAYQAWKTKSVNDLSWGWVSLFCLSNALWVIYGFIFNLLPIILANLTILSCMIYIIFVKIQTKLMGNPNK